MNSTCIFRSVKIRQIRENPCSIFSSLTERCIGMIEHHVRRLSFHTEFAYRSDFQSISTRLQEPCPASRYLFPAGVVRIHLVVAEIWGIGLEAQKQPVIAKAGHSIHMDQVEIGPHVSRTVRMP